MPFFQRYTLHETSTIIFLWFTWWSWL